LDIGRDESRVAGDWEFVVAEVAELDLGIGWGPEVEANGGPDRNSVCKVKDNRWGGDLGRHYVEGVGAEGAEREVLEGFVSEGIPRATEGAELNGVANVY